MSASMIEMRKIGTCRGYDLLFNPVNRRIIAERKSDLATALFEYPSFALVRNWGCPDEDVDALRTYLAGTGGFDVTYGGDEGSSH